MTSKPRNPTPVSNPDRGAHYLKKSPSPTGNKSPPGATTATTIMGSASTADEYLQRKAALQQQVL